jgi:hypothetical protein
MKSETARAREMSDEDLLREHRELKKLVPRLHKRQDADNRELNRRERNRQKAAKAAVEATP